MTRSFWPWRSARLFYAGTSQRDRRACDDLRQLLPGVEILDGYPPEGMGTADFVVIPDADLEIGRLRIESRHSGESFTWPPPVDLAYLAEWVVARVGFLDC